jgi:hypothetical protein
MGYSPPFDELQLNRFIEMDRSALGMKGNTNEEA